MRRRGRRRRRGTRDTCSIASRSFIAPRLLASLAAPPLADRLSRAASATASATAAFACACLSGGAIFGSRKKPSSTLRGPNPRRLANLLQAAVGTGGADSSELFLSVASLMEELSPLLLQLTQLVASPRLPRVLERWTAAKSLNEVSGT